MTWIAQRPISGPVVVVPLAADAGSFQSLADNSRHGLMICVAATQLRDALPRREHTPCRLVASSRPIRDLEPQWLAIVVMGCAPCTLASWVLLKRSMVRTTGRPLEFARPPPF